MSEGSVQDESIKQVEDDMRMLEELLQKNRFHARFQGRRGQAKEEETEYQEGQQDEELDGGYGLLQRDKSYGELLRILNDEGGGDQGRRRTSREGSSKRGSEEYEAEGSPGPVEVTDLLYDGAGTAGRGSVISSFLSDDENEGELTLRDLALQGGRSEEQGRHEIPTGSAPLAVEGDDDDDDDDGGSKSKASKKAKAKAKAKSSTLKKRPEDLIPTTLKRVPRNRHSMANVMEQVSAAEIEELTFRPRLAWGTGTKASGSRPGTGVKASKRGERIETLSRPMTDKWTQRELEKLREEMAEASKYPFQPSIGDRSSELAAAKTRRKKDRRVQEEGFSEEGEAEADGEDSAVHEPIEVRLMKSNEQREAQLRQAKLEREYAELMHCTFKPNIAKQAVGPKKDYLGKDYKPIHQRLHKVLQDKSLRLASARMSKELEDPDLTFAPKINPKSAKLAHMKAVREELSTIDRLASGMVTTERKDAGQGLGGGDRKGRAKNEGGAKVPAGPAWCSSPATSAPRTTPPSSGSPVSLVDVSKVVPREYLDCTFSPQINPKSKEILSKSEVWNPDFHKRQEHFVEHRQRFLSEGKRTEDTDCTFRPNIGNAREFLRQQANKHLKESKIETVTRLSSRDLEEKRIRETSIRESYYSQFNFEPKLTERSRELASATDLDELVYNERGHKIRRSIARQVEEEFNSKFTFRPDTTRGKRSTTKENVVPTASLQIAGDKDTVIHRIEAYRQEKELRIREFRQEREEERMQECTFAPRTNSGGAAKAKLNKPVVVHGLTRFLRNRELARAKETERRQRELEVFATGKGKPKSCYTVAEPFRLSKSRTAKTKMDRLRRELEDEFERECTFKPRLNRF
ncbi:hypothetical protein A3770_15p74860 [Chloropicon primus]|uniref:Uncharacterized protein n=1 Tax=Chloropicon primus TaxID=1764295 RepID=A0A5B8MVY0_9CHLO|nr:hypothetical protein A3770_15p74860 [Chloropicon primus]|eukprot:QDZ24968.1 hypothetical protein A3770_15p74860 [Chloropicon primus]